MTTYASSHPAVLEALGDPTRRSLVELLAKSPMTVGEIAAMVPVSRPAVSQHLKILLEAGLVTYHPRGTSHIYRLEATGFDALRRWLDGFWAEVLDAFETHAQKQNEKD